jgi:hypothetical protein
VPWPTVSVQSAPQLMPAGDDVTVPRRCRPAHGQGYVLSAKVAVTDAAAVIATTQVPVPEQPAPLQPVNVEPPDGVAVSVTEVPWPKLAEQVAPQVMPAGDEVTVPAPVPALVTASVYVLSVKVAVTVVAAVTVTAQVPVPEQPPPLQPVNVEPATGVAVSVTDGAVTDHGGAVGAARDARRDDVTVPVPVPALVAVSVYVLSVKVAVTRDRRGDRDRAGAGAGAAAARPAAEGRARGRGRGQRHRRAVGVGSVQSAPQLMPAGDEVTVPAPVPALVTVSANGASAKSAVTVVAPVR